MSREKFYITTAISYPNGKPHIGHAYELIATDAMARFQRLDGMDVFFLTGTDEHGQKMQQTARAEGISPEELAQRNSDQFRAMGKLLNASNDDFIRTTEERHHETSRNIWNLMAESGDIYKDSYAGWYSVRDEAYYGEDETEVRTDGVRYGPQGTPVEWVEEESYFFKLSEYQDRLLKLYEENPEFIGPAAITLAHRYNEDSRDHGKKERMAQLNSQNGVWSCTFVGYCSEVCPKHVDPAAAIQQGKVESSKDFLIATLKPR